ncbi:MAG: response regulator [Armatimonadetes bacterium]|nr:response regulator [Armatimonadota bacterium]
MEHNATILIIDDNPDVRQAVQVALRSGAYTFRTAESGRVGLATAFGETPDLIVLDLQLPELHGIDVCRQLKASLVTRHIPIVVVTAEDGAGPLVEALEAGADDYVRKPFDPRELQARVGTLLRRTAGYVGTDSLTKLPGNALLRDELARRLEHGEPMTVCYVDIDNFKAYVDMYGFEPASRAIQETARICYNVMVEHGSPTDFIGHIGGDDFVVVTDAEHTAAVCDNIIARFEERRARFYPPEDLERGGFHGLDRDGNERDFPLMTLTIAVLVPTHETVASLHALAAEAARYKRILKRLPGSNWRLFERPA